MPPPLCPRFLDKTAERELPGSGAGHQQDRYDRLRNTRGLEKHSLEEYNITLLESILYSLIVFLCLCC